MLALLAGLALVSAGFAGTERADVPLGPDVKPPVILPPAVPGGGPANDDCVNATVISGFPFTDSVNTAGSSFEAGEPAATCTSNGASVWYSYTNSGAGSAVVTANTCTGSSYDTVLDAFTGSCGNLAGLTSIACNDDSCGLQSQTTFVVPSGQTALLRASGFGGATGTLGLQVDGNVASCPDVVIDGTLGSGSPSWPSVSGTQTGRLNRNGVASSCAAPKVCNQFDSTPGRAFDAYTLTNDSGALVCISVVLDVITQTACNLQVDAYDGTFDPNNICANYLADPGLSSGIPPNPTSMSFEVNPGQSIVLNVHTTNPGEIGCQYDLTVVGDLCQTYVPPVIQEIPTLNHYGIGLMALLVVTAGLLIALRRRA